MLFKHYKQYKGFLAICISILSLSNVYAYQPKWLEHSIKQDCQDGSSRKIIGYIEVKNLTEQTLKLKVDPLHTREYGFEFAPDRSFIHPGEIATIRYEGGIFQDGKWQINVKIELSDEDNSIRGTHLVDLYYFVQRERYRVSNYEELFLRPDIIDEVTGNSFRPLEDAGQIKRSPDYEIRKPSLNELVNMRKEAIYQIPFYTRDPIGGCNDPDCNTPIPHKTQENSIDLFSKPVTRATVQAQGEFSWKGMDSLLHPAFGWRVRAWRLGFFGWKIVAEDWIEWNGKWKLNFPQESGQIKFQYIAFNRFFTPLNSSDDTYRWVGPTRPSISLNHNEGSWFADTSGGNVRGLGEIYHEGMTLWSKLYWTGGISPLRSESIKVYFPNTTYDCGDGTGNPWSCASKSEKIWLIPSHASRNGVMQHELGHQINYEYWDNNTPSDSGGSHTLTGCFTPGLALLEGFANFIVFWTQSARGGDPQAPAFDFRIENPSSACTTLNKNESWVAATFWDLHDTRFDGSDNLWFIHEGAVPAIYLREGKKNSMADFHPVYRSKANVEHRGIIDDIFEQNHIIAPSLMLKALP